MHKEVNVPFAESVLTWRCGRIDRTAAGTGRDADERALLATRSLGAHTPVG
jgi:hypothetical protein